MQTVEIAPWDSGNPLAGWDRDPSTLNLGYKWHHLQLILIQGEQTALVDTSHEKFRQLYLDTLMGLLTPLNSTT